jgi:Uncharacterized ATPase, putative transposase
MITTQTKERVIEALREKRENFYGSDARFAKSIGVNSAIWSRIKNGETEKVLSEGGWLTLARECEVALSKDKKWQVAKTPVFEFIVAQLGMCQKKSLAAIFCDRANIGKTFAAKWYARNNPNVVYIDCSQDKSKQKLIKHIAKELGVDWSRKYNDVYDDTVYCIKTIEEPMIILDEAGDLQYDAFLEIKALWNATEGTCGFYMIGANGLRKKIETKKSNNVVGYEEVFSRFGDRFSSISSKNPEQMKDILLTSATKIIKANAPAEDCQKIIARSLCDDGMPSMRRVYKELIK